MGVMLIIRMGIVVVVLALLLVLCFVSSNYKWYKMFRNRVYQIIFYNTFLRYVLQSTLKLQVVALIKITIAEWEDAKMQIIFSGFILSCLTIAPLLFWYLHNRNFLNLWKPSKKA